MSAPTNETSWIKIAGLLLVVGVAAVVVNLAAKSAYDLIKNAAAK